MCSIFIQHWTDKLCASGYIIYILTLKTDILKSSFIHFNLTDPSYIYWIDTGTAAVILNFMFITPHKNYIAVFESCRALTMIRHIPTIQLYMVTVRFISPLLSFWYQKQKSFMDTRFIFFICIRKIIHASKQIVVSYRVIRRRIVGSQAC